jgi:hypothetical protein
MHDETYNDEMLLDRLVDGELASAERRRLLESFDRDPEGWRRCALAFLEAQSWREELGQIASASPETATEKMASSAVRSGRKSQWTSGIQWLALAASLLLAFGLGWIQREHAVPVAGTTSSPTEQIANVSPQANQSQNVAKTGDALTLFAPDETGHIQTVRVPLVDASTLDKQYGMRFQTGLPDTLRDQLKNRGYTVQSKRQFAPLWLENGQPMIVPVEDTKIVPVNEKLY